jgi:hypothetical protein
MHKVPWLFIIVKQSEINWPKFIIEDIGNTKITHIKVWRIL